MPLPMRPPSLPSTNRNLRSVLMEHVDMLNQSDGPTNTVTPTPTKHQSQIPHAQHQQHNPHLLSRLENGLPSIYTYQKTHARHIKHQQYSPSPLPDSASTPTLTHTHSQTLPQIPTNQISQTKSAQHQQHKPPLISGPGNSLPPIHLHPPPQIQAACRQRRCYDPSLPPSPNNPIPLIRYDPTPALDDMSDLSQVIRFAQRRSQIHNLWRWHTPHVAQIIAIITSEWISLLNTRLDDLHPSPPLWKHFQSQPNPRLDSAVSEIYRFLSQGMQRQIRWRISALHMRVLGSLDVEGPNGVEFDLEQLADVAGRFGAHFACWGDGERGRRWVRTVVEMEREGWEVAEADLEVDERT
ncbi:hypothetical protein B0J11DRAFT_504675 [Dendryphion nanum]|uniref:Uncharacterized protein n=1 Tax=Dendryphion nanum TaxID=256645 RepID=A0A9P9DXB8_9PLEO|nr:hypothetical protein B0J11DRAFT_504675 [Dendryphion nanum]